MSIAPDAPQPDPAPFGGAVLNLAGTPLATSAPPNGENIQLSLLSINIALLRSEQRQKQAVATKHFLRTCFTFASSVADLLKRRGPTFVVPDEGSDPQCRDTSPLFIVSVVDEPLAALIL